MNQKLVNQLAFEMAREILGIVGNCLRPEEYRDAFECFFEECKAGLEAYEIQMDSMNKRLKPSVN